MKKRRPRTIVYKEGSKEKEEEMPAPARDHEALLRSDSGEVGGTAAHQPHDPPAGRVVAELESGLEATLLDDRVPTEEGAASVHASAPVVRLTAAEVAQLHQPAADAAYEFFPPSPDTYVAPVVPLPPLPPAAVRADAELARTLLQRLPAQERQQITMFCEATETMLFPYLLALITQSTHEQKQMQKAKQMVNQQGQPTRPQESFRSGQSEQVVCQYHGCPDPRPFTPERPGQLYHVSPLLCGFRAAGRLTAQERMDEEIKKEQAEKRRAAQLLLEKEAEWERTIEKQQPSHYAGPQPLHAETRPGTASESTLFPAPPRIEGECNYCHLPITSNQDGAAARQGQLYHDGVCGHLARGKTVPGAAQMPEFAAHQAFEQRRRVEAQIRAEMPRSGV